MLSRGSRPVLSVYNLRAWGFFLRVAREIARRLATDLLERPSQRMRERPADGMRHVENSRTGLASVPRLIDEIDRRDL